MNWKKVARSLLPPVAIETVRRIRDYKHGVRPGYIWKGVYPHYREVPMSGGCFEGDEWLNARRRNFDLRVGSKNGERAEKLLDEETLLPYTVSILGAESGSIRILDFGGGLGESYADVRNVLAEGYPLDYHVVEKPLMCAHGRTLFAGDNRIHFHEALPDELSPDVIYVNSALQYVEDYAALLRRLCAYRARFILFVKLSAGAIPTYATAQRNLRQSTIPYWFINIEELIDIMRSEGYALIFRNLLAREYDQDNFPEKYRMSHACNLLFAASDPSSSERGDK